MAKCHVLQWRIQGGGRQGRESHLGPNSFIFMQFSAKKNCKIIGFCTSLGSPIICLFKRDLLGPVRTWRQRCVFLCRHVRTVTLVTMQPISDDMVTTSKICVGVAKCEWTLTMSFTGFIHVLKLIIRGYADAIVLC